MILVNLIYRENATKHTKTVNLSHGPQKEKMLILTSSFTSTCPSSRM